jgi:uncharacterized RmlC-like cupin family protein
MGESIRKIGAEDRRPGAGTPGMLREEAVQTETMWAGLAHTDPGMVSGWHYHGEYESVVYVLTGALRMESGPGGRNVVDAGPGDFIFVPKDAVHREGNPSREEALFVVVRSGQGEPVINVAGPDESD